MDNYKDNSTKFDRGENCIQRHLYEHFQRPGHTGFLQDTYVTLMNKTNSRTTGPRLLDSYSAPVGLNIEGNY